MITVSINSTVVRVKIICDRCTEAGMCDDATATTDISFNPLMTVNWRR